MSPMVSGALRAHCVRLHPGEDLISSIQEAARQTGASACFVVTCVGSLDQVTLRMASHTASHDEETNNHPTRPPSTTSTTASDTTMVMNDIRTWNEPFEIVSLVGTLAPRDNNAKHLHLAISDANGTVFGGHLISGRVFTTAELVLGSAEGGLFAFQIPLRDFKNW
ncbi:DUF296-containing protein [Fragilaria crotonensis]|nr:DUF296-containing protein [Fragilaria crotonensis]